MELPYDTQALTTDDLNTLIVPDRFREWPPKQNNGRFYTGLQTRPHWPVVVAEGDSWFDYQHVTEDIIHHLGGRMFGCAIKCLASHGHQLNQMVQKEEWLDWIRHSPLLDNLEYVLFSGGGNDLLHEDQLRHIALDKAANPGKSGAGLVDTGKLNGYLDAIDSQYRFIVEESIKAGQAAGIENELYVLAHGYDYAVPDGRGVNVYGGLIKSGPWLTPVLRDEKHIDDLSERQEIVNTILDGLNDRLKALARDVERFVWVDVRNTLVGRHDWNDEIHPTNLGAQKVAGKIMYAIQHIEDHVR